MLTACALRYGADDREAFEMGGPSSTPSGRIEALKIGFIDVPDVTFKENNCPVRDVHAAKNLNLIMKMTMNLLWQDTP